MRMNFEGAAAAASIGVLYRALIGCNGRGGKADVDPAEGSPPDRIFVVNVILNRPVLESFLFSLAIAVEYFLRATEVGIRPFRRS